MTSGPRALRWILASCVSACGGSSDVPAETPRSRASGPSTTQGVSPPACEPIDPPVPDGFGDCSPREVTGSPPCERVCQRVRTGPEPRFRTIAESTLYVLRGAAWRAAFSWTSYDGPLDPVSIEDSAAHTLARWDDSTSPPTLVLRDGRYHWSRGAMRRVAP